MTAEIPEGDFYPCVGLAGLKDTVRLGGETTAPSPAPAILSPHSPQDSLLADDLMAVDYNEDDWRSLNDVNINGQVSQSVLYVAIPMFNTIA